MVRMNDFGAEPEAWIRREMEAVERVLRSGWYVLGQEVSAFEAEWAKRCGVPHAVGTGNGMDAIEIGLRALGIGPGDEVITTPMTAFATTLAILRCGARPVFADIDPATALLDPDSAARCLSPRTRAVLTVHLYGQVRHPDAWAAFCREHGLVFLEDCAQAHLASWEGTVAGGFGAWGAYSFYPTKNLGTAGDAGALVTALPEVAERAAVLRNYGQRERYHHPEAGLNSRLDELHAAILRVRLEWLDELTRRRRGIASAYFGGIRNPRVELLAPPVEPASHVFHLFVVRCDERDRLQHHLREAGIETLSHYPVPVHRQPPCAGLGTDPEGLPQAERHAACCLSLPCHPAMSAADVGQVIEAVNGFA